ncbi:hypothetical protein BX589_10262 [Paraburkholderia fungorum]|nr:hypothetical protein BX589_10262 [Paraburkholderia fungorum]
MWAYVLNENIKQVASFQREKRPQLNAAGAQQKKVTQLIAFTYLYGGISTVYVAGGIPPQSYR